jgi:hypothetical protein
MEPRLQPVTPQPPRDRRRHQQLHPQIGAVLGISALTVLLGTATPANALHLFHHASTLIAFTGAMAALTRACARARPRPPRRRGRAGGGCRGARPDHRRSEDKMKLEGKTILITRDGSGSFRDGGCT